MISTYHNCVNEILEISSNRHDRGHDFIFGEERGFSGFADKRREEFYLNLYPGSREKEKKENEEKGIKTENG
jgi:hypothetical protein